MKQLAIAAVAALLGALLLSSVRSDAQETGWDLVLELPSGEVQAVAFASDDVAWAVSFGGIFRSEDAGRTWSLAQMSESALYNVVAAPDGQRGWTVGALGKVYATDDAGRTWTKTDPGTDVNLSQVAAIDDETVLVAGSGVGFSDAIALPQKSSFRRSGDGGATWREISLDGFRPLALASLGDGKHAWAAADDCVMLAELRPCTTIEHALFQSTDGGVRWTKIAGDIELRQLQFVDDTHGWGIEDVCANDEDYNLCTSVVARTEDGGATWQLVQDSPPGQINPPIAVFRRLQAVNADEAMVLISTCDHGCKGELQRTTDGGETWQVIASGLSGWPWDLVFSGDNGMLAAGGDVRWSADGGLQWQAAQFPVTTGSGAVDFVDDNTGWFSASRLLRTTDGGLTFVPIGEERPPDVIDFVSTSEGWGAIRVCEPDCASARIDLRHTSDGGQTWQTQYTIPENIDLRVSMMSERDGWAHSLSPRMLLRTTDGVTWQERAFPTTLDSAHLPSHALAVAASGVGWFAETRCQPGYVDCVTRVWRTLDGARTWDELPQVPFDGGTCVASVEAVDAQHAWVVACPLASGDPVLFRTTDGGQHWQSLSSISLTGVQAPKFFDARVGRAVASICDDSSEQRCHPVIARTGDGGLSWTFEPVPFDQWINGFQFTAPERAWFLVQNGGGMFAVMHQKLYRYQGSETATPIFAPDAGTGPQPDVASSTWPLALLATALAAAGVVVLRRQRRIARR